MVSLAIFILAVFAVQAIGNAVGAAVSPATVFLFDAILAALFLLPLRLKQKGRPADAQAEKASTGDGNNSERGARRRWNQAGLAAGCAYVFLAVSAHQSALGRVKNFATMEKLEVQSLAALPFPPSLWRWDGLVRTPRGVYEVRMDLSENLHSMSRQRSPRTERRLNIAFIRKPIRTFLSKRPGELPEVQKVLWFDRFPVTRFHEESGEQIVEFSDLRFPQMGRRRTPSFTYRVRFGPGGNVLSQGWAK